ncbi:hypothetical protein MUY27_19850 [Mucilaginibacter sp. RS28]|uniref:Uncharacterized protein n=1 Tax=Mucilaginibacter straminoryzae TaxID=2932774 RepID=A0A9X2BDE2_9SPHI|nr:hypothetical protein [Mucilaginibacter straminoryzae]MCJ8211982.1 hypothetical protein [Mucilaginibacter straminoryzae]
MTKSESTLSITLKSLLGGWVALVFGTSTLVYFFSPIPHRSFHQNPVINGLRNIWEIADDMGPVVKLSIIAVFAVLYILSRSIIKKSRLSFYTGSIIIAVIAVLLVLALLPADLSRGYGIRLTGARFDLSMLPIYLSGAVLGGVVFSYIYFKLSRASLLN